MTRFCCSSSVLTILVLLISLSFFPFSTSDSIIALGDANSHHRDDLPGLPALENMEGRLEQRQEVPETQEKEEEELFKNVDPKRLAAVLLEALKNYHPQQERGTHDVEHNRIGEEIKADRENVKKEEAYGERADRHRDGRQELEMWIALHGKEREGDQEEERKKALEEEEKITEKVTSHTSSHMIQIQTEPKQSGSNETAESAASQQETPNPEQGRSQEEEQLNSKELKSLENVMKEFPRLNTKRGDDSEQQLRESRAFSSYNNIGPGPGLKGSDLSLSKKKLKWQEETQKALHFPAFKEDNSIDKSMDNVYIHKTAQSMSPAEQEVTTEDGSEEVEEELSPEEEEAQARVEQEEMMRQAAEAQQAKTKEEELADIASDMLLRYVVKQNNMNKKHGSSLFYAAEDKRSNEELDITEDDLDPQTIDKLIEISSKLHLPADDVVDIITDVEKKKKKKKDMRPEIAAPSSFLSAWQILNNKNSFSVSKQPSPAKDLPWFQETKPDGFQAKSSKSSLANQSFLPKSEKLFKQDHWFKFPKSLWSAYPYRSYTYPPYYHRKPFLDHYPFFIPPLPRPKYYYYISKPALTLNNFPGTSIDDLSTFSPKRRYRSRVLLPSPHSHLQQKSYFARYHPPIYPQQFQQDFIPKVKPPPRTVSSPSQRYTSGLGPAGIKKQNYLETGKSDRIIHGDLEKFIQQTLMNRQQTQD